MNPKRLAEALNTISMGFAEAAEALSDTPAAVGSPGQGREVPTGSPGSPAPTSPYAEDQWLQFEHDKEQQRQAQPSLADESVDFAPQGSLTQCPKHHATYIPSKNPKWQPYCPAQSTEPGWSNDKGYCTITPKSAVAWLRQQAAVTA